MPSTDELVSPITCAATSTEYRSDMSSTTTSPAATASSTNCCDLVSISSR